VTKFIPPGFKPVLEFVHANGVDEARRRLATGEPESVHWSKHNGQLYGISRSDWLRQDAEIWLQTGQKKESFRDPFGDQILIKEAEPVQLPAPEYLSPFLELMIKATRHFNIRPNGALPKKADIVKHFEQQKLPDGTPISPHQAKEMATFVRPPHAMKGGQKKMG
jgi:hypothetical protein